jgi:hypothetical protein
MGLPSFLKLRPDPETSLASPLPMSAPAVKEEREKELEQILLIQINRIKHTYVFVFKISMVSSI